MTVKWKEGFNYEVVVDRLKAIRTLRDGKASFTGFEYHDYMAVFKSMLDLGEEVATLEAHRLITQGVHAAAKEPEFISQDILRHVKRLVRDYEKQSLRRYSLITTMNVQRNCNFPDHIINGTHIRYVKNLPKKYQKARKEFETVAVGWNVPRDPTFAYFVMGYVSARNPSEAVEKIFDSIDLIRGIWNLKLNKDAVLSSRNRKDPVNQITLGALHTLHESTGKQASKVFWYDPENVANKPQINVSRNSNSLTRYTKTVRRHLNGHLFRSDVELAVIKYVRALDSYDYNAVFIKLWSVLEFVTDTLKLNYDVTIRRASFCFDDTLYCKVVLEHLRQYRNRFIHTGSGDSDVEVQVYQLKRFVEQVILFHVANRFKFTSLKDAAKFMDLKPDIADLKNEIGVRKNAIKYLTQ